MKRLATIFTACIMLSACNSVSNQPESSSSKDTTDQVVEDISDNSNPVVQRKDTAKVFLENIYFPSELNDEYSEIKYKSFFDSLAVNFTPKNSSLYSGKDEKVLSKDKCLSITRLRNISPLTQIIEIENETLLCYEFRTKVDGFVVLGYLLYKKEGEKYKLIQKNSNLLKGHIDIDADIHYLSASEKDLTLKYDFNCTCELTSSTYSGVYDLVADKLKFRSFELTKAPDMDDEEADNYNTTEELTVYQYVENGTCKVSYTFTEFEGASEKVVTKRDSTSIIKIEKKAGEESISDPLGICC